MFAPRCRPYRHRLRATRPPNAANAAAGVPAAMPRDISTDFLVAARKSVNSDSAMFFRALLARQFATHKMLGITGISHNFRGYPNCSQSWTSPVRIRSPALTQTLRPKQVMACLQGLSIKFTLNAEASLPPIEFTCLGLSSLPGRADRTRCAIANSASGRPKELNPQRVF
jgi:hypothetical protein